MMMNLAEYPIDLIKPGMVVRDVYTDQLGIVMTTGPIAGRSDGTKPYRFIRVQYLGHEDETGIFSDYAHGIVIEVE